MQPDGIVNLAALPYFRLKNSNDMYCIRLVSRVHNRLYKIDKAGVEYGMYHIGKSGEELVGFIVPYDYYFKINANVCGITLSKEFTYNEIIITK